MAKPTAQAQTTNPSHSMLHNFHVDVKMFGAVGDGVADDGVAITSAIAAIPATGGIVFFPPGIYKTSLQLTLSVQRTIVRGWGATIKTVGALSGLRIAAHNCRVEGLKIDHSGNASATYGVEIKADSASVSIGHTVLDQMLFIGDSSLAAGYAAIRLASQSLSDVSNTGAFWTRIRDCSISSITPGKPFTVGMKLEGGANHTVIEGCTIGNCVTGISSQDQSGDIGAIHTIPNAVTITTTDISGCTDAIKISSSTSGSGLHGPMIFGNRFEGISGVILSIPSAGLAVSVPPFLLNNGYIGTTTLLSNPNSYIVNALEPSETPSLGVDGGRLRFYNQHLFVDQGDSGLWNVKETFTAAIRGHFSSIGSTTSITDLSGNGVIFRSPDTAQWFKVYQPNGGPAKLMFDDSSNTYDTNLYRSAANTLKTDDTFLASTAGLGTKHEGAATPTGGTSGEVRVGNGKIWVNDAGTWKSVAVA